MKKTIYITTPIYYSSGNVHIGNSYTTIACDAYARFNKLIGNDTYFLTGMDEHGQKIEESANKLNRSPQEHVDIIASQTKEVWKDLQIEYNDFIRTSEVRHTKVVEEMFEKLLKSGDIYLGEYEGNYCVSCEAFYTKSQLGEGDTCPDCGRPTILIKEESYFLKLSKYEKKLLKFIEDNPTFIEPATRKNEVVAFIKSGLNDLAVSRTSFNWGIHVRSNPKHVVYVWIDALANYLTALGYGSKDESLYNKFWLNADEVVHVVGKDILRFHAIYWPVMLMALDIPVKFKLYVHGWILMKQGKMSKSIGNVVYPSDIIPRYGLDSLRYYLLKELPLGNDGLFTYERFFERFNSDLANDLGNLLSRTTAMIKKYFDGFVSKPKKDYFEEDKDLREVAEKSIAGYLEEFKNFKFQAALSEVWTLISRANKYIDETKPWLLARSDDLKESLNNVLYNLYEVLRLVAIMISPVLVDSAKRFKDDLNLEDEDATKLVFGLTEEVKTNSRPEPLFKRLDIDAEIKLQEELEAEKEKNKMKEQEKMKDEITIDDFNKLDLRIGEVVNCKKDDKSEKLLILDVDVDGRTRQIVSSIAEAYEPKDLIGKKIVVLVNLKPVKIRGHLSEGMLLCASKDDKDFEVLEVKKNDKFSKVT